MIIGVTGYGATGASACIDLLKEFEDVQSFYSSFEFQLLQQPDGLCDLKYFITKSGRRLDNSCALGRFTRNIKTPRSYSINVSTHGKYIPLTKEYVKKLSSVSWKGRSAYETKDFRPFYDVMALYKVRRGINKLLRYINPALSLPLPHVQQFSTVSEDEFDLITKQYLRNVFEAADFNLKKPILAEQLFNTVNPIDGMEFFDDARTIIVDRDPRDVYIQSNVTLKSICGFMPNAGSVEDFVRYYRALHSTRSDDPRVLYVQYENLIFHYEESCQEIANFIGLNHIKKGEAFKPQHSINNTQQYLNYPELSSQISYIENELSDLLYPFDENKNSISFVPVKMKPFVRQIEADHQIKHMSIK